MAQLKNNFAKQEKNRLSSPVSALALAAAGFALLAALPAPARAGFEWVPPEKPLAAPVQDDRALLPEMPALPRDSVEAIDMGAPAAAMPSTPPASPLLQPAPQVPVAPFAAAPQNVPQDEPALSPRLAPQNRMMTANTISAVPLDQGARSAPAQMSSSSPSAYEEAVGFGTDIPLALAMRQIVPAEYAYVFSGGVDQGARIDWNGGRPWNEVLAEAVRPHGLEIAVSGQTVRVFPQGQNPAPQSVAPVAQPMLTGIESTAEAAQPSEAVREVYIRRNASGTASGAQSGSVQTPPVVLSAEPAKKTGKSGFWSHFGLNSSETTTIRNEDKIVSQQGAVNPPAAAPSAAPAPAPAPQAPGELIASMHDSQIYESEINAPMSLTAIPAERVSQAGNPYMMDHWSAEQGDSLRNVLQSWSQNAGVELRWNAATDFPLPAPVRMQGSYTDALSQVLGAYDENGPRPVGRLHPNLPAGPSVLIIESSNG